MKNDVENQLKIILKGVENHTDKVEILEKLALGRSLNVKLGLDPSAPDIHIGHAVVLRKIKQMQDLGHRAIIIIGDFTGMIGDPTGKSKTRKQLTHEQVLENAETYKTQIFKILDPAKTEVRFNSEWLGALSFGDVIKLAANTTLARMLERDDFAKRYASQQPIALHEFFYPLMQAYDSVAIQADVELGGTDQTFNILMGRNIQKDYGQVPQLTLFMPLLEGLDGVEKMSKSLGNYIGISEPANIMFEKVMQVPDSLIIKYYNLATDVHPDEIATIEARLSAGENPRDIKFELARVIVGLYHGADSVIGAEEHFRTAFQKGVAPDDAPVINARTGDDFVGALIARGDYQSKSELRRLFDGGAVRVNGERADDVKSVAFSAGDVVQVGKGTFYKIV